MQVAWLQPALDDLRGIHDYIAGDKPAAARRVVAAVRDATNVLREQPGLGRAGRIEGTRELVVRRYPYIIAYRQAAERVEVLAVVHSSRLWPESLP